MKRRVYNPEVIFFINLHNIAFTERIVVQTSKSRDCLVPSPKDACNASETDWISTPSGINPKERKSFAKPRVSRLTKCTS